MFRKDLIPILLGRTLSISGIAGAARQSPKEIIDALAHLAKSLKHTEHQLIVHPAECKNCGFKFRTDKFTRPSKCPKCRRGWISEPEFSIEVSPGFKPGSPGEEGPEM